MITLPKLNAAKLVSEIKRGRRVYLDSETCGLHGMMVLLQWAVDDGQIVLWDIWKRPVGQTLKIIEAMLQKEIVMFNSAFDWFHMTKLYSIFRLLNPRWIPEKHINEIAAREDEAKDGPCIKPRSTMDLLLHSRKGKYQSLMARSDIHIRRVPTALAYALVEELENRIQIDDIYFARQHDKEAPRWNVYDIADRKNGGVLKDFKDVVLRFHPAGGLKFLAEHALGLKPKFHFKDVEVDGKYNPKELGYAPTASAVSSEKKGWEVTKDGKHVGYAWPGVIQHHIDHWAGHANARIYAEDDIVYTRGLAVYFGNPEPDDDDSVLACGVASVRWRGYKINIRGIKRMLKIALGKIAKAPVNINKPKDVRKYLSEVMSEEEALCILDSTNKKIIEKIKKTWVTEEREPCVKCYENGGECKRCNSTGIMEPGPHPAAVRAGELLAVKLAVKEVEIYRKLLKAGRLHASFKVIGALSSRMSGTDGLNPQGIKKTKDVRELFTLSWPGDVLCGGDFDSFEVVLADAVWGDKNLRHDLMHGKKIHALFAMALFPGVTYEEVLKSEGTDNDLYTKGKQGVFGTIYGGDHNTLIRNLGVTEKDALAAFNDLSKRYPDMAKARAKTFNAFCSMKQPVLGGQVFWHDPADYIESFLGVKRHFTLENMVCKALFHLAQKPPKEWRDVKVKVRRRDKEQWATGAVASALYGAAFQIQAANTRAAANHEIQSPGATITKKVQRLIWDLQPHGVSEFKVQPMNIHDELLSGTKPDYVKPVTEAVRTGVESFRDRVPLIGMKWNEEMASWAEKKDGSVQVHITYARPEQSV